MTPLERAIELSKGPTALAKSLGVSSSLPLMWKTREKVPESYCPGIEFAVGGAVTCEELRPDIRWFRVVDAEWPHTSGRPLIDPHPAPAQQAA